MAENKSEEGGVKMEEPEEGGGKKTEDGGGKTEVRKGERTEE
jgi:hypothetical protein